jgi:hypothetical protein
MAWTRWAERVTVTSTRFVLVAALAWAAVAPGAAARVAPSEPVPLRAAPSRLVLGAPAVDAIVYFDNDVTAAAVTPAGLRLLDTQPSGQLRDRGTFAQGAATAPSALLEYYRPASDTNELLITDRVADQVVVLKGARFSGRFEVTDRLPTGHEPVAMVAEGFTGRKTDDVIIADAGADQVTVLPAAPERFGVPRAFAVGARPVDVVAEDLDGDRHVDLAVVCHDGRALTVLYGDGRGGVLRRQDIALPGHPIAIAKLDQVRFYGRVGLNGDGIADLLVAYDDLRAVSVLLSSAHGPRLGPRVALPARGVATAAASGAFNTHRFADAAIAQRDPGTVTLLLNDGRGHLTAQRPIAVGRQPVALATEGLTAENRDGLLIADGAGAVEAIYPGDRFLTLSVANELAGATGAIAGTIYYTQLYRDQYRLFSLPEAPTRRPRPLPIPASSRPIVAYAGESPSGRKELTYTRCDADLRCVSYVYAWPRGPERRYDPPGRRLAGCHITRIGRWHRVVAYLRSSVESPSTCPDAQRGLWVTSPSGGTRRLTARTDRTNLGVVRDNRVVWNESHKLADGHLSARIRIPSPTGPPITIDHRTNTGCKFDYEIGVPVYDAGYLYWMERCSTSDSPGFQRLKRAPIDHPRCVSVIEDFPAANDPDITVDRGRIFYADATAAIFQVAPRTLTWPRAACHRRT